MSDCSALSQNLATTVALSKRRVILFRVRWCFTLWWGVYVSGEEEVWVGSPARFGALGDGVLVFFLDVFWTVLCFLIGGEREDVPLGNCF